MHSYGHPCKIDEIKICKKYNIFLIEDGAEKLAANTKINIQELLEK